MTDKQIKQGGPHWAEAGRSRQAGRSCATFEDAARHQWLTVEQVGVLSRRQPVEVEDVEEVVVLAAQKRKGAERWEQVSKKARTGAGGACMSSFDSDRLPDAPTQCVARTCRRHRQPRACTHA